MARWGRLFGGIVCGSVSVLLLLSPSVRAAYTGPAPLLVINGGTGAVTLAAHGHLIGEGTAAIVSIAPCATVGVALVSGGASADPSCGAVAVAGGGTGVATLTAHGVLLGEGTGNVVATAVGTNGQMFLGATAGDPGWQTMSGDATLGTTGGLTLATVNGAGGSCTLCTITSNAKGLITAFSSGSAGGLSVPAHVTGSASTQTLATTSGSTTISDITVAATWSLPAIQAAGYRQCLKDGTTGFQTFNQTVKPNPTSLTIDNGAGTTGVILNQNKQELCFMSDGTNWIVE